MHVCTQTLDETPQRRGGRGSAREWRGWGSRGGRRCGRGSGGRVGRERGREILGLGSEAVADAGTLRKRYAHEARRAARARRVARAALQSFETRSAREFSHRQSLARGDAGGKGLGGDVLLGCAATGEIGRSSGGGSVDEEAAAPAANTSATQRCAISLRRDCDDGPTCARDRNSRCGIRSALPDHVLIDFLPGCQPFLRAASCRWGTMLRLG